MARTLLIGLDGATFTVLDPLIQRGHMPFLGEFLSRGVHAPLVSTSNPLTPPAWTTMVTGRTPGHHGIFDFIHARETADGYYFTLNMSHDVRCPTIWAIASRQGKKVTHVNFPVSYPPEPIDGYCLPGFVHWRHLRRAVHPPEFYDQIRAIPGFDAQQLSMDMNQELKSIQQLPPDEYASWIRYHIQREGQLFQIVRHVLSHDPSDLTGVVFDGVDKLQHLCWRFLDEPSMPRNPSAWEREVQTLCLEYFARLDRMLAELVEVAGRDARVFLASDHGFTGSHEVFFANVWLARAGYLAWAPGAAGHQETGGRIAADRIKGHVEGIDWSRTVAYALTPSSNGIYIRRASEGRPGVSDADYEGFRARLKAELLGIRHPDTGAAVIRSIMTREEAFPGPSSARAPDLTLVLADHGFLSVLDAEDVILPRPEVAGTHHPHGIFAAAGPGIRALGRVDALAIADVAPALLHSLGLATDEEMEGVLPAHIFVESPETRRGKRAAARPTPAPPRPALGESAPPDPEVDVDVIERLRALGYLSS